MFARWLSRTLSYRQRLILGPLVALLPALLVIMMLAFIDGADQLLLLGIGGIALLLVLPFIISVYRSIVNPYQLLVEQITALSPESLASESFVDEHLKPNLPCGHELGELYEAIQRAATYIQAQHQQIRKQNRRLAHKNKELLTHVQRVTQARQAADRVSAEKDNFIANISHELRTPLSGVVAAVEMIEQTVAQGISSMLKMDRSQMSATQVQALRTSRQEVREILTIIDEILKPSSSSMEIMVDDLLESLRDIAYGDVKLHVEPFSLEKVFSGTARAFEDMAFKKGLIFDHVVVNNSSNHNLFYQSDWTRIGQVLNNLLNNSIRFTQEGGITLKVEINPTDKDGLHRVNFVVKDTGCGISESERGRIFNLFHIGEDPTKKEHSGLGTGLAIASKVAEKLGGKVYLASSQVGKGSVFIFELLLKSIPEQDENLPAVSEAPHHLSLLYVEDSKVNRSIFKQFCHRANINLQMAVDGNEGWEKYRGYKFDALVVDCFMPNKNGFELVKEIREFERDNNLPRVPIFALTADPTAKNKKRCLDAGFDEFLTKPYRRATFNFILEKAAPVKEAC
jgi:signal transduction histidine kinase/CheY-like chemotaxis protein